MAASAEPRRGLIYTFYSFKGGVGRSMALANVAALLARWGKRVLIVDWDLEAPGIDKFFERWTAGSRRSTAGLVDLICDFNDGTPRDWNTCLLKVSLPQSTQPVHILSAGRDDPTAPEANYGSNLLRIKWEPLFEHKRFGAYLERLRREWTANYDFVLIDSRTGITDIGGICTIHLPDILVCLFTTTEQSLGGVKDVMQRAKQAHAALPVDRRRLLVLPIPARDESRTEYKLAKEWRSRFAAELGEFFRDWAPKGESAEAILDLLKLPYVAFWSFGERLPVLEEDIDNPDKLAYFYQLVGRLMLGRLDLDEVKHGKQVARASEEQQAEAARRVEEATRAREKAQREAAERELEQRIDERLRRRARYESYLKNDWISSRNAFWVRGLLVATAGTTMALPLLLAITASDRLVQLLPGLTETARWILFITGVILAFFGVRDPYLKQVAMSRERALFAGEAGPYATPDLASLPLFIERSEKILNRAFFSLANPSADWSRRADDLPQATSESPSTSAKWVTPPRKDAARPPLAERPLRPRYDVFLSWRRDPFVTGWIREQFLPLFTSWLAETLPHEPNIFFDEHEMSGTEWAEYAGEAAKRSACLVAVVTPAYFQSELAMREWESFRQRGSAVIVPVLLRGSVETIPPDARTLQTADFREYAYVGEGFQKTDTYVEFQRHVQRLIERVSDIINQAPRESGEEPRRVLAAPPE